VKVEPELTLTFMSALSSGFSAPVISTSIHALSVMVECKLISEQEKAIITFILN
jgi:hypothetical protein